MPDPNTPAEPSEAAMVTARQIWDGVQPVLGTWQLKHVARALDAFAARAVEAAREQGFREGFAKSKTDGYCPFHNGYHRNTICEHGYGAASQNEIEAAVAKERARCKVLVDKLTYEHNWHISAGRKSPLIEAIESGEESAVTENLGGTGRSLDELKPIQRQAGYFGHHGSGGCDRRNIDGG